MHKWSTSIGSGHLTQAVGFGDHIVVAEVGSGTVQGLDRLKGGCLEHQLKLYMRCVHLFKVLIAFYMFCMGVLFAHLRHGFWSAFQSIGALNWRLEKPATLAAIVVAATLAVGFLGIPVYIFLTNL